MTLNDIKEHMSRNQFKTIANKCGYKCERPADGDHGVDFRVDEVVWIQRPQGSRLLDTGRTLQFQLKATTEKNIQFVAEVLKFDLEVKTYNDLVDRKDRNYPLTLVLVILPDTDAEWVVCGEAELNQRTKLFWFRPSNDARMTNNESSIRISIPINQRVDLNFLKNQFEELFK